MIAKRAAAGQETPRAGSNPPLRHHRLTLWIAARSAHKVEKRLELVLSGEWTTDEAKMLAEGVRIRVV